jgi:hypothetical protein
MAMNSHHPQASSRAAGHRRILAELQRLCRQERQRLQRERQREASGPFVELDALAHIKRQLRRLDEASEHLDAIGEALALEGAA